LRKTREQARTRGSPPRSCLWHVFPGAPRADFEGFGICMKMSMTVNLINFIAMKNDGKLEILSFYIGGLIGMIEQIFLFVKRKRIERNMLIIN
jgi:hypothetical protein